MERSGRRILLAVEPGVLEGALARMILAVCDDEVVQMNRSRLGAFACDYDAAVVSDELPDGIRTRAIIMLPDTRGGAGTGTVTSGQVVHEVSIDGAERVIELLEQYAPCPAGPLRSGPVPGGRARMWKSSQM